MTNLRIIFAGTPDFAVPSLKLLLEQQKDVIAVYTQPDRPKGRGQILSKSPIKELAESHHLSIQQPLNFSNEHDLNQLRAYQPDVMVVVAYGLILPETVLDIPRYGCINIHPSLLPKYRGALPVQQAILDGETETGVTIIKMDKGMDSGPIYCQTSFPLSNQVTAEELLNVTAHLGAQMLLKTLSDIESGHVFTTMQSHEKATYTRKLHKESAKIDWSKDAESLQRQIRAYIPWPIAYFTINDLLIRVWEAEVVAFNQEYSKPFGSIIQINKNGLDVVTGKGVLRLHKLQLPGKKVLSFSDILNGHGTLFRIGDQLSS